MGKFVTRKDDSLITYKIGQIFPSFHKKLIQTFISGLDAPRCSVWVKKKRAISKDVLFLPLFTLSPLFSTLDDFFYLSLFVPDPSAGLSSCLGCQYITGAHFWLNEDSGDMSVVRAASPKIGNNKLEFRFWRHWIWFQHHQQLPMSNGHDAMVSEPDSG